MKTNTHTAQLVAELKKASHTEAPLWGRLASDITRSNKRVVNLSRIEQYAKDNEVVVVPGKVLGGGNLNRKVTVAAFEFSKSAKDAINKSGKTLTIKELLSQNPKAKGVRILG